MPPEMPANYSGQLTYDPESDQGSGPYIFAEYANDYETVHRAFLRRTPILSPASGCPGTCEATIHAGSLEVADCRIVKTAFLEYRALSCGDDASPAFQSCNQTGLHWQNSPARCPVFTSLALYGPEPTVTWADEGIHVEIGMMDESLAVDGIGNFTRTRCALRPAIGSYDVLIYDNGTMNVNTSAPRFVTWANNTNAFVPEPGSGPVMLLNSTFAGLVTTARVKYMESMTISCVGPAVAVVSSPSKFTETLMDSATPPKLVPSEDGKGRHRTRSLYPRVKNL